MSIKRGKEAFYFEHLGSISIYNFTGEGSLLVKSNAFDGDLA